LSSSASSCFTTFHDADRQLSNDEHVARVSETAGNPGRDPNSEIQYPMFNRSRDRVAMVEVIEIVSDSEEERK
jgi:hypothetical protein